MLTAICKATFDLSPGRLRLSGYQEPIAEDDDLGEAGSLRYPSDFVPFKPRVDVIAVGHCFAQSGEAARSLNARLSLGTIDKRLEISGLRSWQGNELTRPDPFDRMELTYALSGGGPGTSNPIGIPPGSTAAPSILYPGTAPQQPSDRVKPAGFGPISAEWPQRRVQIRKRQGWWSRRWNESPLPEDIDEGFFNAAPPDQQLPQLGADDALVLEHLHPRYPVLETKMPGLFAMARVERAAKPGPPSEVKMRADTLWIDTDRSLCVIVWRTIVRIDNPDEPGVIWVGLTQDAQPLDGQEIAELREPSQGDRSSFTGVTAHGDDPLEATGALPSAMHGDETDDPPTHTELHAGELPQNPDQSPAWLSSKPRLPPPSESTHTAFSPAGAPATPFERAPASKRPPPLAPPPPPGATTGPASTATPAPMQAPLQPPAQTSPTQSSPAQVSPAAPPPQQPRPPAHIPAVTMPQPGPASIPQPHHVVDRGPLSLQAGAPKAYGTVPHAPQATRATGAAAASPASNTAPEEDLTSDITELLWFDPELPLRLRGRWKRLVDDLEFSDEDPAHDLATQDPEKSRHHHLVFGVLARGRAESKGQIRQAMRTAVGAGGRFTAPLVLISGRLQLPFSPVERLRVTSESVAPFAQGDKALKDLLDEVQQLLGTPFLKGATPIADGLNDRLRKSAADGKRARSLANMDRYIERVLLDERAYQKRNVFGAEHVRATIKPTGDADALVAYLPEDASAQLPLVSSMRARIIGEAHLSQDEDESQPLCVRVLAFGRVLDRADV